MPPQTLAERQSERRQFLIAHIALSDEPLNDLDREWLEGLRPRPRSTTPDYIYPDPLAEEPRQEPFTIEDAGYREWLGWDNPAFEGELQGISLMNLYKADTHDIPVLEREEVGRLARSVQSGLHAKTALEEDPENKQLQELVEQGAHATHRLWKHNLRLVPYILKKRHLWKGRSVAIDGLDMIQVGNMALLKAIEHYDPDSGAQFGTYAEHWIFRQVKREIANRSRTIRLSGYMHEQVIRLGSVWAEVRQELGREPTVAEIASRENEPESVIRRLHALSRQNVSLDTAVPQYTFDADAFAEDSDNIPDEQSNDDINNALLRADDEPGTEAQALSRALADDIWDALEEALDSREHAILAMYYGFEKEPMTYEEIGREFGVSGNRIFQLVHRALAKLRRSPIREQLQAWKED